MTSISRQRWESKHLHIVYAAPEFVSHGSSVVFIASGIAKSAMIRLV